MKVHSLIILFLMFSGISTAQVSVMTYNIKYANENDGENSWSQRKDWLVNQIGFHEPEIFGVQEAVLEQLQFLKAELEDYDYLGEGREGGEEGEFTAIFYDKSRFELLQQDTFWLSETPDVPGSKGWDAAITRVATWARFRDRLRPTITAPARTLKVVPVWAWGLKALWWIARSPKEEGDRVVILEDTDGDGSLDDGARRLAAGRKEARPGRVAGRARHPVDRR